MQNLFTYCLLLVLLSCSSNKPKVPADKYLKLNTAHATKHNACIKHRDQILVKSITELEDAPRDDENYFFVRNEKAANKFLNSFDLTKFTTMENNLEHEAIVLGCVQKPAPKHQACETLFPSYKFFRGLLYGMTQYEWSPKTVLKAKDITLEYLKYQGENEHSLMGIALANDLLMRLSLLRHIDETLYTDTLKIRHESEKIMNSLKEEITKRSKKALTCGDAQYFYEEEKEYARKLGKEFLEVLSKAK